MAMNVLHSPPQSTSLNRISGYFWRNPGMGLFLLLLGPLMWFGIVYFGSLLTLLWQGFYTFDDFTMSVTPDLTLANLQALFNPANYDIILRTLTMAVAVTIASAILAFLNARPGYSNWRHGAGLFSCTFPSSSSPPMLLILRRLLLVFHRRD